MPGPHFTERPHSAVYDAFMSSPEIGHQDSGHEDPLTLPPSESAERPSKGLTVGTVLALAPGWRLRVEYYCWAIEREGPSGSWDLLRTHVHREPMLESLSFYDHDMGPGLARMYPEALTALRALPRYHPGRAI